MSNLGSLRALGTASLLLSAGFFQSCAVRSDDPEDQGGSTSGGNDSAGNTAGGATSGTGAAGVSGSLGGVSGAVAGSAGSIAGAGGSIAGGAGSIAGAGGSIAGCAGSTGGASGSGGGSAGSTGGVSGWLNEAGSTSAGGSGGSGDPSLPLLLSTNIINFPATECGTTPTSKTFTITNPSSVSKTWRSVPAGASTFLAVPTGSSLAPGEVVTVTVTPPFIPIHSRPNGSAPLMTGVLAINDGASFQSIMLSEPIAGAFYAWTPANLSFGVVPLNTSATLHLTQSGDSSGRATGDNSAFVATISPLSWHDWTFTFNATTSGTQTATFTWVSIPYHRAPCTPDTFTATAFVQ